MVTQRHGPGELLQLRGVSRSWSGREVLRDVDLSVARGSVTWIGGANGAGKTTLLRIAAGVIAAERGIVALQGLDPRRDRREYSRRLGWLPAGSGGVYNRLTVRQNVAYAAAVSLVSPRDRPRAVDSALAECDLEQLADNRGDRVSAGERQRVRLAMTLVHRPQVLLLDEPNTSLDPEALQRLGGTMASIAANGGATIWCAPSRLGVPLPADVDYVVEDGTTRKC